MSGLDNRVVYETVYTPQHLTLDQPRSRYDRAIAELRFAYLREFAAGRDVADLGCGTGSYLLPIAHLARAVYAVDFSGPLLRHLAARAAEAHLKNVRTMLADVRALPLRDHSVDFAFSIATLYYVPEVARALAEAARILRPGGRALFELGNRWSLNTLVAKRSDTGVRSYHISLAEMRRFLAASGFRVDEHRAFQLLPMYGGPLYLRPLVSARWKAILGRSFRGRLLDERVSSLPLLRGFAFRHLFVCTRAT